MAQPTPFEQGRMPHRLTYCRPTTRNHDFATLPVITLFSLHVRDWLEAKSSDSQSTRQKLPLNMGRPQRASACKFYLRLSCQPVLSVRLSLHVWRCYSLVITQVSWNVACSSKDKLELMPFTESIKKHQ